MAISSTSVEKPATVETSGEITIHGKAVTIRGAEIRTRRLVHDYDGTIKPLPERNRQTRHSTIVKYGRFLEKASSEYSEDKETVIPTTITAKDSELSGIGSDDLQSVMIKEADMHVTEQLKEIMVSNDVHIQVINRTKGVRPRPRGDPPGKAIQVMMQTNVPGISSQCVQESEGGGPYIIIPHHIGKSVDHLPPLLSVAQTLLSKFTTGQCPGTPPRKFRGRSISPSSYRWISGYSGGPMTGPT
jgi:hypothetical protein